MMRKFLTIIFLFNVLCLTSQINPNNIQGLTHWYSADSLNKDINGLVDTIYDLSSNNDHLHQANSTNQPQFIDSGFNNRPIVNFNGSTKWMETLFSQTISQAYTVFAVWKTTSNVQSVFLDDRTNVLIDNFNGGHVRMFAGNGVFYTKTNPFDFIVTHAEFNGASSKLFENNTLKAQGNVGGSNLPGITMGKRTVYNDRFFHGDFSQLLIYEGILTSEQIDSVNSYLYDYYVKFVDLGSDVTQYSFCDTTVYAGKRFDSYLWSDGSTADSLIVSEPGSYWVEVTDVFGYVSRDTVEVVSGLKYPVKDLYCKDGFINWQPELNPAYTYLWSDGSTADSLAINSPGDYHVVVTDTNGCVFKSDTLSISEDPFTTNASLGPDTDLCTGNRIGLTVGAGEATSYTWNTTETTPEIEINTSGTYSVEVQNANGCVAQDTVVVNIIGDAPLISVDLPTYVCSAAPFDFEDLSTTTDGSSIISWDWDFGDGSSATTAQGVNEYAAAGMYDVSLIIETSSGCFNSLTVPVEVKENPIMTFTSNYNCQHQDITFNGGQLSPQTISDWSWNFGDPSSGATNTATDQNTSHIFDASGDFEVMLVGTDIFGCIDTVIQTQTIVPTPVVAFNFTEVCEGNVVNYQNASTVVSPASITTYQWDFGDGTNSGQTNPQKPYASQGTYTVVLTATANNGCSATESENVKIHAIPQVNYTLAQACAGIETRFTDNSFISNGSVAQVDWTINGLTALTGFTVTNNFANSGTYSLEQTVQSAFGCVNSAVSIITIRDFIEADFIFSPNAFVTGYPIEFTSTSTGALEYEWTFGDFANSQEADTSIVFEVDQVGETYDVELWIRNIHGCTDSTSIQRTVLERETDLEVSQLFSQEENGYLTIGVQLKNIGTTPINMVDLYLRKPSLSGGIKETWSGNLQAGQSEIYIFSAAPSATVMDKDADQNYLCIEGRIVSPAQFAELDIENNEVCRVIAPSEVVLIHPYPNPVSDQLTIKVVMPAKEVIALHVYNDQGRLVHTITEEEELQKGLNTFYVNTSGWAAGNYKIRTITSTKQVPTVGFVKL